MKIVFFGDSITDMVRTRDPLLKQLYRLGSGYVFMTAEYLAVTEPGQHEIVNAGISGNKITDLEVRVDEDVIKEKPDMVSIFIGVNDVWHGLGEGNARRVVSFKKFKEKYDALIKKLKCELPGVKIILMEPYFIDGIVPQTLHGFEKVYKYARAVKRLAKDNDVAFVPLQKELEKAGAKIGNENVCYDGVHPNLAGSSIISKCWLKVFKKIR